MTAFKCIFVYICVLLCGSREVFAQESQDTCRQLSVVIFFTDSSKIPSSASGMKFLDMCEMARVKHSIPVPSDIHPYIARRNTPNCKELLKEGLDSLTHFCQNALGMKTAIVSVSSQAITNDINGCESHPPNQQRETWQKYNQKYRRAPISNKVKRARLKEIITSPEHEEVFKIRVKRDESDAIDNKVEEIPDFSLNGGRTKPPWDVLDVMSHVKFSFFGSLFDKEKKKKMSKEDYGLLSNLIGQKKQDPGLFETVRSTLATLQETPGEAFLMVVFGGHLSEICDKHSPLVQSLKHVTEVTDPASTLIITTGACPCDCKRRNDDVVFIKENAKNGRLGNTVPSVVPVYAKGPKSEKLTQSTVLYDIPLAVKNILEEFSPTFGDTLKEQMRQRRSSSLGVPLELRNARNEANRTHFSVYGILLQIFVYILYFSPYQ